MRRAKNAVVKKLPGDLVTKNGYGSFTLGQRDEITMGAKGRQVAGTDAANAAPLACPGKARICSRHQQSRQHRDHDNHQAEEATLSLLCHIVAI